MSDEVIEKKTDTVGPESQPVTVSQPEPPPQPELVSEPVEVSANSTTDSPSPSVPPEAQNEARSAEGNDQAPISNNQENTESGDSVPETKSGRLWDKTTAKGFSIKAVLAKLLKRTNKLERIMAAFDNPRHKIFLKEGMSNDDVQILLGVSDATAVRYLDELMRQGKLVKVGKGNAVRYKRV